MIIEGCIEGGTGRSELLDVTMLVKDYCFCVLLRLFFPSIRNINSEKDVSTYDWQYIVELIKQIYLLVINKVQNISLPGVFCHIAERR